MACYHPQAGYVARNGGFTYRREESALGQHMTIPCGQCIGCRLQYSRDWATRVMHEDQMHYESCFLTLTYSDDKLPLYGSLVPAHMTKFLKRLRKRYPDRRLRYFLCGEYGSKLQRPHYHMILFGLRFEDLELWRIDNGQRLYTSKILEKIWGKGYCSVGHVTWESAAYVARYMVKKFKGKDAWRHYMVPDIYTGELYPVHPEFVRCSRGSGAGQKGLGQSWIEKYKSDVYPHDYVVLSNGKEVKPPRAYDKWLQKTDPEMFALVKAKRKTKANERQEDNTWERLLVRETCHEKAAENLYRRYESDL